MQEQLIEEGNPQPAAFSAASRQLRRFALFCAAMSWTSFNLGFSSIPFLGVVTTESTLIDIAEVIFGGAGIVASASLRASGQSFDAFAVSGALMSHVIAGVAVAAVYAWAASTYLATFVEVKTHSNVTASDDSMRSFMTNAVALTLLALLQLVFVAISGGFAARHKAECAQLVVPRNVRSERLLSPAGRKIDVCLQAAFGFGAMYLSGAVLSIITYGRDEFIFANLLHFAFSLTSGIFLLHLGWSGTRRLLHGHPFELRRLRLMLLVGIAFVFLRAVGVVVFDVHAINGYTETGYHDDFITPLRVSIGLSVFVSCLSALVLFYAAKLVLVVISEIQ